MPAALPPPPPAIVAEPVASDAQPYVDIVVTEQGYADLRGLSPRERAPLIIERCVHPMYRDQLREYYEEALLRGGQTPHVLEKAFSWHTNFKVNGTMRELTHVSR